MIIPSAMRHQSAFSARQLASAAALAARKEVLPMMTRRPELPASYCDGMAGLAGQAEHW